MSILLINGPNLNHLGTREPEIYGATTLADVEAAAIAQGEAAGHQVDCFQSNHEGAIVDRPIGPAPTRLPRIALPPTTCMSPCQVALSRREGSDRPKLGEEPVQHQQPEDGHQPEQADDDRQPVQGALGRR